MDRSRGGGSSYWADRLNEPGVTAVLSIEAGPPFLGPALSLGGAAALLLAVQVIVGMPESPVFLLGWMILLPLSILAGGSIVSGSAASRWIGAIGVPPERSMLLGIVGDQLVIWRWPQRGNAPSGRLVAERLADVTLRPRMALLGSLDIELASGRVLFVNHSLGPGERQAIDTIIDTVASAHGGTRPQR